MCGSLFVSSDSAPKSKPAGASAVTPGEGGGMCKPRWPAGFSRLFFGHPGSRHSGDGQWVWILETLRTQSPGLRDGSGVGGGEKAVSGRSLVSGLRD